LVLVTVLVALSLIGVPCPVAMEKHGIAAVLFMGVKSIKQALNAKVVDLTRQAKDLGIKKGMSVRGALEMMM